MMTVLAQLRVVDPQTVVLLSVLAAMGLVLILLGWFGLIPTATKGSDNTKLIGDSSVGVVAAGVAGIAAFAISGWPVLALFAGAAGWYAPTLRRAKRERRDAIERIDAIATWVETVRDNISGAAGLSQALRNSGNTAPAAIRVEVRDLVLRLQHEPLIPSLRRFAADLAHPTGDMAIGCLILAASRSAGSLSDILANTAQSARDSATMMRNVEAGRVQMQSQGKLVAAITGGMSLLMILEGGDFLEAYNGVGGQFVLFIICSMATACAVGMYRLGKPLPVKRVFRGVETAKGAEPMLVPEGV